MSCPKYTSETEARNYLEAYLNAVKPDDTGDMERAIIQCLLADSSCIKETTILLPEMFADKLNREIFISMKEIAATSSVPFDFFTISTNLKKRKIDITDKELTHYLFNLSPVPPANIKYYIKILSYLYLQTQFYEVMSLSRVVLGEKANVENFFEVVKPALIPLNRALFETYDRPFKPHWITNGTTTYKVLKSKFDSGGYVWVDKVAVKEVDMLACGFEKKYEDPGIE